MAEKALGAVSREPEDQKQNHIHRRDIAGEAPGAKRQGRKAKTHFLGEPGLVVIPKILR
ncbi:MAG: hypothetical protein U9R40_01525 [Synergistota bacterium]|nr:hypothetical protein [Synergistota bacterium]